MSVRVGVIGCGAIACWAHLPALRNIPGATLVTGAEPDPAARARAARLIGGPVHEHCADLLARDDVDAVVISAPPLLHAALTAASAAAGKHMYVEKPLATEANEAREAIDAVARAGVVGTIGFNYRWHPAHQRARAWLKEGRIGAVRAVQTAFCEPTPDGSMPAWKRLRASGGGVLLDLASHHVDLLRWCLDDEVASVGATLSSIRSEDDTAAMTLMFRSGIAVTSYFSFCAGPVDFLLFIGEGGTIRVDRHAAMPVLRTDRRQRYGLERRVSLPTPLEARIWAWRLVRPSYQPSFRRSLAAFIARLEGASLPLPSLEDGARSLAIVLAAEESARRGTRVPVIG